MNSAAREVIEFVKENDVKFIRLSFCDLYGLQKNISIMAEELPAAFKEGISFDAHAVKGFRDVTQSDLLLYPEADTITVLPWRPGSGRVARFYCEIKESDGRVFAHDGRHILKQIAGQYKEKGYDCRIGTECEFYLFKTDDNGEPSLTTLDRGGYLDIAPLDKGEDIRREICLTLEEMGIKPESSHHEQGPGQNEIDFKFSGALIAADNLLTFKSVVKSVAARNGLFASFMPKPLLEAAGSGLHINLSLARNGNNIFKEAAKGEHSAVAESFIAGILDKTPEMTLFLNPIANSYERFGSYEAPQYVSWSHENRSQLVRIPSARGDKVRMELRSPDPSVNPYTAFAFILAAGLEGIETGLALPAATDADLYSAGADVTNLLKPLPPTFDQAIRLAADSTFVKGVVGDEWLTKYLPYKRAEAAAFAAARDKVAFYKEQYFFVV